MPRQRAPTGLVEVNASQDDGYEPKDDQRPLRRSIQRLGMEEGLAYRIADVKDWNPQEEDETNAPHNDQSPRRPGVKVPTEGRNVVQETRTAHQEREHHDHQHEEHQGQHRKRNHTHQHHNELQHETNDLHEQVRQLLQEIARLVGLEELARTVLHLQLRGLSDWRNSRVRFSTFSNPPVTVFPMFSIVTLSPRISSFSVAVRAIGIMIQAKR